MLTTFSIEQVAQGLWFLCDASSSDHLLLVGDPALPWPLRRRCVEAILPLNDQLFATHCSRYFGHLDAGPEAPSPLNPICYMFWEFFPLERVATESLEGLEACARVLRRSVGLESWPCQEGALHGLGHLQAKSPTIVREVIDDFLQRSTPLAPELHAYALRARDGNVL